MGYCFNSTEVKFLIRKENVDKVYRDLINFTKINTKIVNSWSWVDSCDILDSDDIEECFDNLRWEIHFSQFGDINKIEFVGEKLGDDIEFFKVFAQYVEAGSFIECCGEDGDVWRWIFDGKTVIEKRPKVLWD